LTDAFCDVLSLERHWVVLGLLGLVFYGGLGGVSRLAKICTVMMPPFLIGYIIMCLWVIVDHGSSFLYFLPQIFTSAFTGHAAAGGFAGSTFLMAAQYGTSRAVYSGDIGIGYDSIIQSETRVQYATSQARLAILSLLNNTLICTLSCVVVLVSGLWYGPDAHLLRPSDYIPMIFQQYVPHIDAVILVIFFLVGFTTIMAYFVIGVKAARFLGHKIGEYLYYIYAFFAFIFFAYHDQTQVMLLMSVAAGLLMLCNLAGIWRLRDEIRFELPDKISKK